MEKAAALNLQLLNPDFEYLFFDDRQVELFVDSAFPEYRGVFDCFPFRIQRYDFFRYLAGTTMVGSILTWTCFLHHLFRTY